MAENATTICLWSFNLSPGKKDAPTNLGELTLILILALALSPGPWPLVQNFAEVKKPIPWWLDGVVCVVCVCEHSFNLDDRVSEIGFAQRPGWPTMSRLRMPGSKTGLCENSSLSSRRGMQIRCPKTLFSVTAVVAAAWIRC